jgi:hypothetical protein
VRAEPGDLLPALVAVMIALAMLRFAAGDAHELAEDSLLTLAYLANWARSAGDQMGGGTMPGPYPWKGSSMSSLRSRSSSWLAPGGRAVRGSSSPSSSRSAESCCGGRPCRGWGIEREDLLRHRHAGRRAAARLSPGGHPHETPWLEPDSVTGPIALMSFGLLAVSARRRVRTEQWVWIDSTRIDRRRRGSARRRPLLARLAARPLVWLGERSYSLYLVMSRCSCI